MALFILRPTMFTVVMLSMGTYTLKPFFPNCDNPPDFPVKLITITFMSKFYNSYTYYKNYDGLISLEE